MKKSAVFDTTLSFAFCLLMLLSGVMVTHASAANETVVYDFQCNLTNACGQFSQLTRDHDGNLYATVSADNGCTPGTDCNSVVELSPNGSGAWTETVLYTFQAGNDGDSPVGGVILDKSGNLYGVTQYGAGRSCKFTSRGCGAVFELKKSASGWTETLLSNFQSGTHGAFPQGGLVFDSAGDLYGTTNGGGANVCDSNNGQRCGTVFELSPSAGDWSLRTIYNFKAQPDAANPFGSLVFDQSGRLYGVAGQGAYQQGTVYRLKLSSTGWIEDVLWNFTGGDDGGYPQGILVNDGHIYGTAIVGGSYHVGTVFELIPSVGSWQLNLVHTFTGGNDGGEPAAGMVQVGSNLYGTSTLGGLYQYGTVYAFTPSNGGWTAEVVYNFTGGANGANPNSALIPGPNALFGVTSSYAEALAYEIAGK